MLSRESWLDLARALDWQFSYVREEEVFPPEIAGTPLAAPGPVGRLGRALPDHLRRIRRQAAREGRGGLRRARRGRQGRGLPEAAGGVAQRSEAARRRPAAGRVRRGDRQPARRAFRPQQRLADDGAVRRPGRVPPHPDPALADARAGALGPPVRLDLRLFHIEQLGGDRRAPPGRRAAARHRPDRVRDRDQLRASRPASPTCSSSGWRRWRAARATRCSRRW